MIRSLLAGAAALTAVAGTTSAQAQSFDAYSVIPSFNFQFIEPTLQAAGVSYQRVNMSGASVLVLTVDGLRILIEPTACVPEKASCYGLDMVALFASPVAPQQLDAINNSMRTIKVGNTADGASSYARRYLIADYGYTRGSLIANISVFASSSRTFQERAFSAGNQVSYTPETVLPTMPVAPGVAAPGDDFANDLNARQKSDLLQEVSAGEAEDLASAHNSSLDALLGADALGAYANPAE